MKLYAKSNRTIKTHEMISTFRKCGAEVKSLGEYDKWKTLNDGGRLQVKMTIYEVTFEGKAGYFLSDTLERVACNTVLDKQEVFDWLKEKGYKPERQWYLEDYGMSEETWNEWNNAE